MPDASAATAWPTVNGTFTIPGADVTGAITVTVEKAIKGVSYRLTEDFINGYTLILVKGGAKYAYDGHGLYEDSYTVDGETYQYAYVMAGKVDDESFMDKLTIAAESAGVIGEGFDVNGSGSVSFEDAQAVFGIASKVSLDKVSTELLLRADVNRSGNVNGDDVAEILLSEDYTF